MITTDSPQTCSNECHPIGLIDAEHSNEMIFAKWYLTEVEIDENIFHKYRQDREVETLKNAILNQYIFFHVSKNKGKVEWRQIEYYVNVFIDNIVGRPIDEDLGNPFLILKSQLHFHKASEIDSDIFPCPEYLCKDYHSVITVYFNQKLDLGA
jgi:hypothetical protein